MADRKRVAIVANFNIREKAAAALQVAGRLASLPCEVLASAVHRDRVRQMGGDGASLSFLPEDDLYAAADILIVLGGDGSILDASRRAAARGVPILGINLGRVGYMTELELSELPMIDRLFAEPVRDGDGRLTDGYAIEERAMIRVEVIRTDGTARARMDGLNDAVLTNGSVGRITDIELSERGVPVAVYHADGLIIATPTGSTAYSLSAGGPVADPRARCLCVTPVCSHSLGARPLVYPDDAVLEMRNICRREKRLCLSVDGRGGFDLYRGEAARVTRSPLVTNLIRMKSCGFYRRLRMKIGEAP